MLDVKRFPLELLNHYGNDLQQFVIDCINKGYYIFTYINEFYVPDRLHYGVTDFIRENLIYGYDSKSFHIAGFNDEQVFSYSTLPFSELEISFAFMGEENECIEDLVLTRFTEVNSYKLDVNLIIESIEDYLNSFNSSSRHRMYKKPVDLSFGIEVYDYLRKYIRMQKNHLDLCMGNIQIMWEHKKCMIQRLKFLEAKLLFTFDSSIMSQYEEIAHVLLIIRNLMLKYSINRKTEIINKIDASLEHIKNSEREVLNRILNELKKRKRKTERSD
jgi:hypothetical protein